jgi:thiol-disulfide isomerase/thioredoxin
MKDELSTEVRNGVYKPFIDHAIALVEKTKLRERKNKEIQVGSIAPYFSLKTLENTPYDLSMILTDYIVLDFWGSWCLPCIEGFPEMKNYYKKYRRKVEFIGIACKDKEVKWREAVKKHNLPWTQLINNSDQALDVSLKYAVGGYPTKVIIDKNKTIVGIFEGESDDFYNKLDELMK